MNNSRTRSTRRVDHSTNHLERMQKFLNNKNWIVKERLGINEFEPFTKVSCDVISLTI